MLLRTSRIPNAPGDRRPSGPPPPPRPPQSRNPSAANTASLSTDESHRRAGRPAIPGPHALRSGAGHPGPVVEKGTPPRAEARTLAPESSPPFRFTSQGKKEGTISLNLRKRRGRVGTSNCTIHPLPSKESLLSLGYRTGNPRVFTGSVAPV